MQHIVKNLQSVTVDVSTYEAQRDFLHGALTDIGYQVVKPQGAFYMFPKAPIDDDVEFTDALREQSRPGRPRHRIRRPRATSAYRTASAMRRWRGRCRDFGQAFEGAG